MLIHKGVAQHTLQATPRTSGAIGVGHHSIRTINYFDKNTESMVYSVTYYSDGDSIT